MNNYKRLAEVSDELSDIESHVAAYIRGLDPARETLVCDEVVANATEQQTDGVDGSYDYRSANVELTLKLRITANNQRQSGVLLERLAFYIGRKLELQL